MESGNSMNRIAALGIGVLLTSLLYVLSERKKKGENDVENQKQKKEEENEDELDNFFRDNEEMAKDDSWRINIDKIKDFINKSNRKGQPIVLCTSGGTTVPLEKNTVRFIDNFSTGQRGAISAEQFLRKENEYNVIFLYRKKSLRPFHRLIEEQITKDILNHATVVGNSLIVANPSSEVKEAMSVFTEVKRNERLLECEFTSIIEYVMLLREISILLQPCKKKAIIYLCAAVSDFYIPSSLMETHKIQSTIRSLHLDLQGVPKCIGKLRNEWSPDSFIVSFKLETDIKILEQKARGALSKYNVNLVIANLLSTRRSEVRLVEKDKETLVVCYKDKEKKNQDHAFNDVIEKDFIDMLIQKHKAFYEK